VKDVIVSILKVFLKRLLDAHWTKREAAEIIKSYVDEAVEEL
jgi:hypothetical protein